ncbi:MAG: signal peptidase II [Melioribacteraceae bacterium]
MRILFVSLFVIIADQISKLLVKGIYIPALSIDVKGFSYGESITILDPYFKFTFVENPGMAFGIHVDGYFKLFLSLFSLIASIGIIIYIYKNREQNIYFRTGFALILGGAFGNMIDRFFYGIFYDYAPLLYGKVVDFIHVDAFGFSIFGKTFSSFPIFNIADSSVTIGVIILILFHKTFEENDKEELKSSVEETTRSIGTSTE